MGEAEPASETGPRSGNRSDGGEAWITDRRIELYAAALLAAATVATAWRGYQSSRWGGEQSIAFSRAGAFRVESARASTAAQTRLQVDIALFTPWADAVAAGNEELADFYFKRFRPQLRLAAEAWLRTNPLTSAEAPLTPFDMPQYVVSQKRTGDELEAVADRQSSLAARNNQRSDNYVLAVVLFASVLFFAGISTKFHARDARLFLLGVGTLIFVGTAIWVSTFPVSFGI